MVKDAYLFMIPLVCIAATAFYLGWVFVALVSFLLVLFVGFFFRDPDREIPIDPNLIVSPADGRVLQITPEPGLTRLSIFLSVFDVHVNRAPIAGRLVRQTYRTGRFHPAFDDRASIENEQLVLTLQKDREITFSLIAGIVARRIILWKKQGEEVAKGDRIALIRFGSRVDIELPEECELAVEKGDKVRAGSSVIARWR